MAPLSWILVLNLPCFYCLCAVSHLVAKIKGNIRIPYWILCRYWSKVRRWVISMPSLWGCPWPNLGKLAILLCWGSLHMCHSFRSDSGCPISATEIVVSTVPIRLEKLESWARGYTPPIQDRKSRETISSLSWTPSWHDAGLICTILESFSTTCPRCWLRTCWG